MDLERTSDGRVFVADTGLEAVLELDEISGDRWIVSGQGVGSGPAFLDPIGLAMMPSGALLVVDRLLAAVVSIDVDTGARTIVSGAGVGSGPAFTQPVELAIESDEAVLVTDYGIQLQTAAVFRVFPASGQRIVMSKTGGPGDGFSLIFPFGITVVGPPEVPVLPSWAVAVAALSVVLAAFGLRSRRSA